MCNSENFLGFSAWALLAPWLNNSLSLELWAGDGHPGHCRMFSSITGLYPSNASRQCDNQICLQTLPVLPERTVTLVEDHHSRILPWGLGWVDSVGVRAGPLLLLSSPAPVAINEGQWAHNRTQAAMCPICCLLATMAELSQNLSGLQNLKYL